MSGYNSLGFFIRSQTSHFNLWLDGTSFNTIAKLQCPLFRGRAFLPLLRSFKFWKCSCQSSLRACTRLFHFILFDKWHRNAIYWNLVTSQGRHIKIILSIDRIFYSTIYEELGMKRRKESPCKNLWRLAYFYNCQSFHRCLIYYICNVNTLSLFLIFINNFGQIVCFNLLYEREGDVCWLCGDKAIIGNVPPKIVGKQNYTSLAMNVDWLSPVGGGGVGSNLTQEVFNRISSSWTTGLPKIFSNKEYFESRLKIKWLVTLHISSYFIIIAKKKKKSKCSFLFLSTNCSKREQGSAAF